MTNTEIMRQIESLNEWNEILEGAKAQADMIKDIIKAEMESRDTEELICGQYIVRYTSVLTSKFDTKRFKEDYEEVYKMFLKQQNSKRFSITC